MSDLLTSESFRQATAEAVSDHPAAVAFDSTVEREVMPVVARTANMPLRADCGLAQASVILGVGSPALLCGLESVIVVTSNMRLAASAQTFSKLLDNLAHVRANVALIDPLMGGHAGVRTLLDAIRAAVPAIRCVLITDEHQPHLVREAVKAGVRGFVCASAPAQEIRTALLEASSGNRYIAPAIAARLAELMTLEEPTSREMDVLTLLVRGDCNKTIARVLGITVGTVKTHVRSIMFKLDSRSRTEAALKACRIGLVGLHC